MLNIWLSRTRALSLCLSVGLCFSISISVCLSLRLSLFVSLSLCFSLSLSVSLCLSVCLYLFVCVCVCVWCACVRARACVCVCVRARMCVRLSLSLSLSVLPTLLDRSLSQVKDLFLERDQNLRSAEKSGRRARDGHPSIYTVRACMHDHARSRSTYLPIYSFLERALVLAQQLPILPDSGNKKTPSHGTSASGHAAAAAARDSHRSSWPSPP